VTCNWTISSTSSRPWATANTSSSTHSRRRSPKLGIDGAAPTTARAHGCGARDALYRCGRGLSARYADIGIRRIDRHRGSGCPLTPATPPCVRVRTRRFEWLRYPASTNDGSPSDLKYALGSPTDRALARARYQAPRLLPAVLPASRGRTPNASGAARRRRGVFH
jgi:hypothetical protein